MTNVQRSIRKSALALLLVAAIILAAIPAFAESGAGVDTSRGIAASGPISVNTTANGAVVTARADQFIEVEFTVQASSQEELQAWYRDTVNYLWVNGEPVEITSADELGSELVSSNGVDYWYGGWRVDLGYLPQGSYAIYWIANLAYEHTTLSQAYAAGGHDFAAQIQVGAASAAASSSAAVPSAITPLAEAAPVFGPVSVNYNGFAKTVNASSEQWIEIEFSLLGSPEEIAAWYADSEHVLYVDGAAVTVADSAELSTAEITVNGQSALYGGFRVQVGQFTPGQHSAVWVMNLYADHISGGTLYAAGSYSFTVNFIVQ